MDFYEVLEQVIELLQRHGRVTYRALKRQFDLDDDYVEDLKDEIIEARQIAVDQDGRILVWAGETDATPVSASQSAQTSAQTTAQQDHPTQAEPPLPEPHAPDAERRQLTVMFCDLVDSTTLSGQLDPEDYREVVRSYQATCSEVIQRYDGHVAQLLGDGLLVYFGYPQAHEDDAQRAVRAALGMLEAIGTLNTRLEQDKGIQLAVRLGIHTGLVVVGEMGGAGRQEQLALGEVPNVASRIQGLAEPNTVAISAMTFQLVEGYFACQDLGQQTLRGVAEPMQAYRVLGESGAQSRLDIVTTRGLTPLVGREQEIGLLLERWNQVKDGQGQVVLLSGEAGIGKSRLVQVLKDHVAGEAHDRLECRSSPYYQHTALYPITDLLQRTLQWQQGETPDERLVKLEQMLRQYQLSLEEAVPLFATLLSLPLPEDRYPPLPWTPQRQRQKTLEVIMSMLLELAERQPVLFILEDLHWTDPTTLEWLTLLIEQVPTASLLTMLTCRPEFASPWGFRSHLAPIALNRFTRPQIETMVGRVTDGKTLPAEVIQHLVEKTDGVPLYVEEMTKAIVEAEVLQETNGHYALKAPLSSLAIPTTLQDALMARLDRLGTVKGIAQLGATLGRTFTYELLQAVSSVDELVVWRSLVALVEAELLYQRGSLPHATFTFKHALIQETAYQSLLRNTRQQHHEHIARVLEERFPETVETQPELLAHHCTAAGLNEPAMTYWQHAGEKAIQRSAHEEAIAHLTKGLELVQTMPDTSEHARQELTLQRTLGVSLLATKGFAAPEVASAYTRARALCQQVEDISHIFPVLFGLWGFHHLRIEWQTARELAEQLLTVAQRYQDPGYLLMAHRALGDTFYWLGEFAPARAHLEQGIALYNVDHHRSYAFLYGQDPLMGCQVYAAQVLWMLGYPDQAVRLSDAAVTWAQEFAHPFSLVFALQYSAIVHARRREWQAVLERTETVLPLCAEQGFTQWVATATITQSWALVMQRKKEGIEQMRQGLTARQQTGARTRPSLLTNLAEAYHITGQVEEGLRLVVEGLTVADETGERYSEAELHRLKGELLRSLALSNDIEAETCFHRALDIARHQQAKSWELRAATSLARLWQSQAKRQDACDLLAPVYGWFTEGFDTADLQEAKALLEELRS